MVLFFNSRLRTVADPDMAVTAHDRLVEKEVLADHRVGAALWQRTRLCAEGTIDLAAIRTSAATSAPNSTTGS